MKKLLLSLSLLLFVSIHSFSLDTGQKIFNPLVRTLRVSNPDNFLAPPILRLGTSDRLNINFDLIGDDPVYLRYRLIHCNADWTPSRLMESEYIGTFNEIEIEDWAFSSNTYIHFINYNVSLPDPQVPILASGNYLMQIFPESEPDNIWLQARFAVSENVAPVIGGITTKTDKGVNTQYQQLFIDIQSSALGNFNPYQDLIISITQNNRPETTRLLSHPMRVAGSTVTFEHAPELVFEAGNEYRRFETVRTDYPGMHVDSVKFLNGMWHAWLQPDYSRNDRNYTYDSTQHGRFKIDEYNSTEPDLSADYVIVHFSLDPGSRMPGPVFVDGDFTNHVFDDSNMMKYDWETGMYQTSLPLKQGSYNYQYVVIPETGSGFPTSAPVEGNKYETTNEYLIQVFLRSPGSRADRHLGSAIL